MVAVIKDIIFPDDSSNKILLTLICEDDMGPALVAQQLESYERMKLG